MKLKETLELLKANENKFDLIDSIRAYHPGYGIEFGMSWYVGGMVDTGDWRLETLLTTPEHVLRSALSKIKEKHEFKPSVTNVAELLEKWGPEKTKQVLDWVGDKGKDMLNNLTK